MPASRDLELLFNKGMAAHGLGKLTEAQACYRAILKAVPKHPATLHFLGLSYFQQGKSDKGVDFVKRALAVKPDYAEAHYNLGTALQSLGRHAEAVTHYTHALASAPGNPDAHNNLGAALQHIGRIEDAVAQFEKAAELQPNNAQAQNNLGAALKELGRPEHAIARLNRALDIDPRNAETLCNLGSALQELDRHDAALASYDKALAVDANLADAHLGRGNVLGKLNHHVEALAAYDRALAARDDVAEAWLGRGTVLSALNEKEGALAAYDHALKQKPDLAEAWVGLGNLLTTGGRLNEALSAYDKAIALKTSLAEAWAGRGNALNLMRRYEDTVVSYDKAMALKPNLPSVEGARLHAKMHNCDWSNFESECSRLLEGVRAGKPVVSPFVLLSLPSLPADQLTCARAHAEHELPSGVSPLWDGERYTHDRIRVAYLSSDFRDHAIPRLLTGLFEHHDRTRFEMTAVSYGAEDQSDTRARVLKAFEHVVDVRSRSDREIAQMLRELEIDIAVDLNGFTLGARSGVLALRPAPVQASYVGFTGTMGAGHIDYILADPIVIPLNEQQHYSEKIVWLPHSYQANDAVGRQPDPPISREQAGLPDSGFVFCSFNNSYKITPDVFDIWMRLLNRVEGSLLWLMEGASSSPANLKREAEERGVPADRIVFAPRASQQNHLTRQQAADLFLDTLPYNAHTTTTDALLAGLPVVTLRGSTFAGRVAASLLAAAGMHELIADTAEHYEALAYEFATMPERLAAVRDKLKRNIATEPLFDSARSARDIEAAYTTMWQRQQRGDPPASFAVEKI